MTTNPNYEVALLALAAVKHRDPEVAKYLGGILGKSPRTIREQLARLNVADEETVTNRLRDMIKPGKKPKEPEKTLEEKLEDRRLRRSENSLIREIDRLTTELEDVRQFRSQVLQISETPLAPEPIKALPASRHRLTFLSGRFDFHRGKIVEERDVFGLQRYDPEICSARIRRCSAITARMIKAGGHTPDHLVIVYGGDNANGELRDDDLRNNAENPAEQIVGLCEDARADIDHLREQFPKLDITVLVLFGNHTRVTKKPPSEDPNYNWEFVFGSMLELAYSSDKKVTVCTADRPDIILPIYDMSALITHGDRIGSNGGDGQIGALGPTKRGTLKMIQQIEGVRQYVSSMNRVGMVWMGHWHQFWTDWQTIVSSSGIGPESFGAHRRFVLHPCRQDLLAIHPERGLVDITPIWPGVPEEGPLYGPGGGELLRRLHDGSEV